MPRADNPLTSSVCPFATTLDRPRNAANVPSVVISAFTPTTVTRKPLSAPTPSAAATATKAENARLWLRARFATITDVNAVIEPTDRSNWPAVINSVPGAATIPITETAVTMLIQLSHARKYCDLIEKKVASPMRKAISAAESGSRCNTWRTR